MLLNSRKQNVLPIIEGVPKIYAKGLGSLRWKDELQDLSLHCGVF